jgi:hypothetical protein
LCCWVFYINFHKRLIDEFGKIWHASQSQTYNILKRLEAKGYITSTIVEQEKLPAQQQLNISYSGIEWFEAWLNQPTQCSVHAIRVQFITRLYFMQQYYPQNIPETILVQLDVVKAGLIHLQESLTNLPDNQTFNRLALELRIKLLNSVISWLDECYEGYKSGKLLGALDA